MAAEEHSSSDLDHATSNAQPPKRELPTNDSTTTSATMTAKEEKGSSPDRPHKTRKLSTKSSSSLNGKSHGKPTTSKNEDDDDPVAQARRALEMFRKEVEGDGDDESAKEDTSKNDSSSSSLSKDKKSGSLRSEKVSRKIMISQDDDPCLL